MTASAFPDHAWHQWLQDEFPRKQGDACARNLLWNEHSWNLQLWWKERKQDLPEEVGQLSQPSLQGAQELRWLEKSPDCGEGIYTPHQLPSGSFWDLSQGSFLQQRASPRKHWQLKVAGLWQYTPQLGKNLSSLKGIRAVHHSVHFSQHQSREFRRSNYMIKPRCYYFSLKMLWGKISN